MGHALAFSIVNWILGLHGWVLLGVVFAFPALEASAFVGIVFPGEIAVILGGVIASRGHANLGEVVAAAIAGAVIGDSVGYYVGHRWGRRILDATLGRFIKPEHLDRAEAFLARRGGPAVFVGRWTAALRVLVPGLAGMARLRYRTFLLYNVAGGAAWATAFVLLGFVAGDAFRTVQGWAGRAGLVLVALIVLVGIIALAGRWVANHPERVRELRERFLAWRPVAAVRGPLSAPFRFITNRFRPGAALGLTLTIGLVVIGLTGWAFGVITQDVLARQDALRLDRPVYRFFLQHRTGALTDAMRAVTYLGNSSVLVGIVLVIGLLWRLRRRTWRPLVVGLGAWVGSAILTNAIKAVIDRPRPPVSHFIGTATGASFPSGHAADSVVVYGIVAALLAAATPFWTRKVGLWAGAVIVWAVVGTSRLYLGVHWLTDVLGGEALGALWLFGYLTAIHAAESVARERRAQPSAAETPSPERSADTIPR